MTDQTSEDPLRQLQQTVTSLGRTQAQTDEILLLLARRSSEHDGELQAYRLEQERSMQEIRVTLSAIAQQQAVNATQIAANAEGIAELRAILRERYNGNGQGAE